jgi:hypothetical protein
MQPCNGLIVEIKVRGRVFLAVMALTFSALALAVTTYAAINITTEITHTDFNNTSSTLTNIPLVASDTLDKTNSSTKRTWDLTTDRTNTQTTFSDVPSGNIATVSQNLGLYSDSACTVPFTNLDWGSPTLGSTVNRTFYVKNTLPSTSLTLSMTATNWDPTTADGPLAITWNRQGTVLSPGQSTEATIILTISSSATSITSFNVQISFSGTT